MITNLGFAADAGSYSNVPDRNKVRGSFVLVQKSPQPSATLVRKIVSGSLKLGSQGSLTDAGGYLSWAKFVEEIQFTHFLGSERQSAPNTGRTKEQFHPSYVFRFAGAVGLPAIVNATPPHKDPPAQAEVSCKSECPAPEPDADDPMETNIQKNTTGSPTLTSEIQKLPHFSPLKAWYRDKIFGSFPNLPGPIRSEQSASKEGKRSELFRSVDNLCAFLEKTNLQDDDHHSHEKVDSGHFTQNGPSSQGNGSKDTQHSSTKDKQRAVDSCKSTPNRKKTNGKRSNKGSSDNEGCGRPSKKAKPGPGLEVEFKCRIFLKCGSQNRCNGEKFPTFESMREHLLRIHIKSNQCGYCWKRFGRRSECKRHEDTICKKKGLVKRIGGSPNDVPNHVINIGKEISRSAGTESLDQVLFPGGIKQYDFLDNTDVNRDQQIPKQNQEAPRQPIMTPLEPLIAPIHSRLEATVAHEQSPPERAPSIIEEVHLQNFTNHTQLLGQYGDHIRPPDEVFDILQYFSDSPPQDGPSLIGQVDRLSEELNLPQPVQRRPETSNIQEIINRIDAESDPSSARNLASQLLASLPQSVHDALVAVVAGGPGAASRAPMHNDDPSQLQNPMQSFAEQVASLDDDHLIPLVKPDDSAYKTGPDYEAYRDETQNTRGGWMDRTIPFGGANNFDTGHSINTSFDPESD